MAIVVAQVVSMLCLGAVTWVVGVLPLLGVRKGWLKESESEQTQTMVNLFSALTCFGGGVILTSCLTHMLPDVNEVVAMAIEEGSFPDSGLPVAEIFVLAGFLMIYMLEEVLHHILVKSGHLKEDEGGHAKSGAHGHSHDSVISTEEGLQATARGFLVILALSIHDLFEGVALGVARRESSVWFLLLAFASHKWVIAGCLGLAWARSALKPMVAILYMTVFCMVSPIGVGVGMALTDPSQEGEMATNALIVLQGLATGSLLYVVFFEILEKERQKPVPGVLQVMAMALGFIFMVLLGLAEVRSERNEEVQVELL